MPPPVSLINVDADLDAQPLAVHRSRVNNRSTNPCHHWRRGYDRRYGTPRWSRCSCRSTGKPHPQLQRRAKSAGAKGERLSRSRSDHETRARRCAHVHSFLCPSYVGLRPHADKRHQARASYSTRLSSRTLGRYACLRLPAIPGRASRADFDPPPSAFEPESRA